MRGQCGFSSQGRSSKCPNLTEPPAVLIWLRMFDVVWMRQDPPFDMAYINRLRNLLWSGLSGKRFGSPMIRKWVRSMPPKRSVPLDSCAHLMPPTNDFARQGDDRRFRARHAHINYHKPLLRQWWCPIFKAQNLMNSNYSSLLETFLRSAANPSWCSGVPAPLSREAISVS